MTRLARLIGCTEGQAYTLVLGVALAVALLVGTVPASFRPRPRPSATAPVELAAPVAAAPDDVAPPSPPTPTPDAGIAGSDPAVDPFPPPSPAAAPAPAPADLPPSGRPAAATPAPPAASTSPAATASEAPPSPLAVLEGGWATAGAGTPAARTGVPPGSLPVAAGAGGSTTRRTFVRLRGTEPVLTLRVRNEGGSTFGDATAGVLACAITEAGWMPAEAVPLEQTPPFDPQRCAPGSRQPDQSWRFDLAGFADRAGRAGFALVPDPARSGTPFQITFDPSTGAPS